MQEGIEEWARVTGENPEDIGCNCCGPPHDFTYYTEDNERHYVELEEPTTGTLRIT